MTIFILCSMFPKRVVAAFIIFVIFAVFVGICDFLSIKILQLLLLLQLSFPQYCSLSKYIVKFQRVQNFLTRVVTRSPRFSRSMRLLK